MAKVRTVSVWCGTGSDRHQRDLYVYRGYYAIVGQSAAFHTNQIIRDNSVMENLVDDDVFHVAHGCFTEPKYFKGCVDEHIEYAINAHGSLENYLALNR